MQVRFENLYPFSLEHLFRWRGTVLDAAAVFFCGRRRVSQSLQYATRLHISQIKGRHAYDETVNQYITNHSTLEILWNF